MQPLGGIHHVTAFCSDPQANVDFYVGVLGLRLVKVTINYDDPGTYHLYYANQRAEPGSVLTFFPWPGPRRGEIGTGIAGTTAFSVAPGSLDLWADRLGAAGVPCFEDERMGGERLLSFIDPDELLLELVETPGVDGNGIAGFHSVALWLEGYERSARLLTDTMGFTLDGEDGNRFRFRCGSAGLGQVVDLMCLPGRTRARMGPGTVHHVAFRTEDGSSQQAWRERLVGAGMDVTPVRDRNYFESIYFREPGRVLYEIATDPPGFAVDEPADQLGRALCLPDWLQPHAERVRAALPKFRTPDGVEFP